jgi:hypothetical protein
MQMGRGQQRGYELVKRYLESQGLREVLLDQRAQRTGRDLAHGEMGDAVEHDECGHDDEEASVYGAATHAWMFARISHRATKKPGARVRISR